MAKILAGFKKYLYTRKLKYLTMMGKIGLLGTLLFLGTLLVVFFGVSYSGYSALQQTGSTTMNVTIRGYVSLSISTCITNGVTFNTTDPATDGNNATCNSGYWGVGGTGYNITVNTDTSVTVNFTHASNQTNLTDGTNYIMIGNVTTHSNSTNSSGEPAGNNLWDNGTATAISNSWLAMEDCEGIPQTGGDCWATYFINIPADQVPGDYTTGYCWCGRQQGQAEALCGTCT